MRKSGIKSNNACAIIAVVIILELACPHYAHQDAIRATRSIAGIRTHTFELAESMGYG